MIVVMDAKASARDISDVIARIRAMGFDVHLSEGKERTIIGVIGRGRPIDREQIGLMSGVQNVMPVSHPYKIASREYHPDDTLIPLNGVQVGGTDLAIIAGPCSVEDRAQIIEIAHAVREAGATALRGGAFKPRSSPYSFQGLGEEGLHYLAEAREQTGLPIVTEVMDPQLVPLVCQYADVLQIGARNMQNFPLLTAAGKTRVPVFLKRSMMGTIQETLMAAEYVLSGGNRQVMICERGIRTFETSTRFTLDIASIGVIKRDSHLPVIVDPSHAAGHYALVPTLARAAVAAGADGLLVEVHPDPVNALSDGLQSLTFSDFERLMGEIRALCAAMRRPLAVLPEAGPTAGPVVGGQAMSGG